MDTTEMPKSASASRWHILKTFSLGTAVIFTSFFSLILAFTIISTTYILRNENTLGLHTTGYRSTSLFASIPEVFSVFGSTAGADDPRAAIVESYLRSRNSPMTGAARTFIEVADACPMDWTLLPAIAGKESSFGLFIPHNSYNAFGWAVYTGQNHGAVFTSWDHGIEVVGRGLCENYIKKGRVTPEQIEVLYTPPSAKSHGHWRKDVSFMMEQIRGWEI